MAITEKAVLYTSPINKRGECIQVREVNTGARDVIDVRRFYTNEADELAPTGKGLMLTQEEWAPIMAAIGGYQTGGKVPAKPRTAASKTTKPVKKGTVRK